jgi:hypothetical protein
MMRIFADDKLVDEVELQKSTELKAVDFGKRSDRLKNYKFRDLCTETHNMDTITHVQFFPKTLTTYELDRESLKSSIKIQCHNSDTNYTNGFMTKYSYVIFHSIFLVPKTLFNKSNFLPLLQKFGNDGEVWPELNARDSIVSADFGQGFNHRKTVNPLYKVRIGGDCEIEIPIIEKHGVLWLRKRQVFGKVGVSEKIFDLIDAFNL